MTLIERKFRSIADRCRFFALLAGVIFLSLSLGNASLMGQMTGGVTGTGQVTSLAPGQPSGQFGGRTPENSAPVGSFGTPAPAPNSSSAPAGRSGTTDTTKGALRDPGIGETSTIPAAANKNRPARPTGVSEDNHYPDGFLTLSKPSSIVPTDPQSNQPGKPASDSTPVGPNVPIDDAEDNIEPIRRIDQSYLIGLSFGVGLLGLFAFLDYRYRIWLQNVMLSNSRLMAPDAAAIDFQEVLYGAATPWSNPHWESSAPLDIVTAGAAYYDSESSPSNYNWSDDFATRRGTSWSPGFAVSPSSALSSPVPSSSPSAGVYSPVAPGAYSPAPASIGSGSGVGTRPSAASFFSDIADRQ